MIETVGVGQSETEVAEAADSVAVVVQPGAGDVLQFLKSGIMEIPDVLVVTKADLGKVALRARRDLNAALRSLGVKRDDGRRGQLARPAERLRRARRRARRPPRAARLSARRLAARRAGALADFVAEHGERGLRALGGRRTALKLLGEQDAALDVPALTRALEQAAAA